jgi:methionine-gamma-lyase
MKYTSQGISTLAIHAGESERAMPKGSVPEIVMASTFILEEDVSFSFDNFEDESFVYSRWGNPTVRILETKIAALENAEASVAFSSGIGASSSVMLSFIKSGDSRV